jgi:hypothetical protein
MTGELEAVGGLATAGAVGAAIEGREGGAPGSGNCPNCDAPLTGRFCSNCGQHAHPNRKLSGVLGEFLYGLWNFDTKAWRTLPMAIFRPGTLTRDYVYGKRARYLSPLTLFLFSIFLMFFAFSTIDAPTNVIRSDAQVTADDVASARDGLAAAQAELERARAHPDPDQPEGLEVRLAEGAVRLAQAQVDRQERLLAEQEARAQRAEAAANQEVTSETTPEDAQPTTPAAEEVSGQTWQDGMREAARSDEFVLFGERDSALTQRVRRKFENPDLALYQVQDAASRYSVLLAPLSLPFIALLFLWKRGVTLYDLMAYALYALAFAAMLFSTVVLLGEIPMIGWAAS